MSGEPHAHDPGPDRRPRGSEDLATGWAEPGRRTQSATPWWKLTAPVLLTGELTAPPLKLKSGPVTIYEHTFTLDEAMSITPTDLDDATEGTPYSEPLSVTGGKEPYSWAIAWGSLPKVSRSTRRQASSQAHPPAQATAPSKLRSKTNSARRKPRSTALYSHRRPDDQTRHPERRDRRYPVSRNTHR